MTVSENPCCGTMRTTPFCPICGTRLTDNEYIGRPYHPLQYEKDNADNDYRWAESRVRELEAKHKSEMAPVVESQRKAAAKCRQISEAIDYARQNRIGFHS